MWARHHVPPLAKLGGVPCLPAAAARVTNCKLLKWGPFFERTDQPLQGRWIGPLWGQYIVFTVIDIRLDLLFPPIMPLLAPLFSGCYISSRHPTSIKTLYLYCTLSKNSLTVKQGIGSFQCDLPVFPYTSSSRRSYTHKMLGGHIKHCYGTGHVKHR